MNRGEAIAAIATTAREASEAGDYAREAACWLGALAMVDEPSMRMVLAVQFGRAEQRAGTFADPALQDIAKAMRGAEDRGDALGWIAAHRELTTWLARVETGCRATGGAC